MERPEQKENPPRNLLTNYEETVAAMVEIEGEGWLKNQKKIEDGAVNQDSGEDKDYELRNSLPGAVRALQDGYLKDEDGRNALNYVIYGTYGMNRWFVTGDGAVIFSKFHGTPKAEEKARQLGFEIE